MPIIVTPRQAIVSAVLFGFHGINLLKNLVSREWLRILENFHFSISKQSESIFFHFALLEREKAFYFHFSLLELQKPTLAGPWHVCICNRNRIWYVWCIELRFTFFRGKEIKSSYSSGHLHKQIFQGTRSSHQIDDSHLSLRIVHLRGKVIKTMIWSGKLHIRRCFKGNIQITNLRDNFWLLYNSFCNIWWHL